MSNMSYSDFVYGTVKHRTRPHCSSQVVLGKNMDPPTTAFSKAKRRHSLNNTIHSLIHIFQHSGHVSTSSGNNVSPIKPRTVYKASSLDDLRPESLSALVAAPWSAAAMPGGNSRTLTSHSAPKTKATATKESSVKSSPEILSPVVNGKAKPRTPRDEASSTNSTVPEETSETVSAATAAETASSSTVLPVNTTDDDIVIVCNKCNDTITARKPALHSKSCCESHKKAKVHFADSDGRNLVQLQQYDKACTDGSHPMASGTSDLTAAMYSKIMVPKFRQPSSLPNFLALVLSKKVHLENAFGDADHLGVRGMVRVLNMAFHKEVYVRWSLDEWQSMCDCRIAYVDSSDDTTTDRFLFDICAPLELGEMLEFAVRYECLGKQYWDNNDGLNYKFVCEPKRHGRRTSDDCLTHGGTVLARRQEGGMWRRMGWWGGEERQRRGKAAAKLDWLGLDVL